MAHQLKTTLNKIFAQRLCTPSGRQKLLSNFGKTQPDDEPISILQILERNGVEDGLACLGAVDGHDREIRLFAVWCARQVQHLAGDARITAAMDVSERFANGEATQQELDAARSATWEPTAAAAAAAAARWRNCDGVGVDGSSSTATMAAAVWAAAAAWDAATANASSAAWNAAEALAAAFLMDADNVREDGELLDSAGARSSARLAQGARLRQICGESL